MISLMIAVFLIKRTQRESQAKAYPAATKRTTLLRLSVNFTASDTKR
ncbi:hypothetical protein NBRC111894_1088 [Sporolactobacillus inulinus]|uniref:Uncharacterized protein n=1 Tax=Sporolactobacillus inulinus TaxID=2078 RepID=A0A4Y1Z960_9BACL|nr:hypothetical protein NBRC111894_1088 [Sporolactobacillus inulinus]